MARRAVAFAFAKELARTELLLIRCVLLEELRPVAARGALERVALFVEAKRTPVVLAVLVGLAEREAQVIAVDQRRGRVRLGRLQPRDFLARELVGFEVREAPVRVAEFRPDGDRLAVFLDRFGATGERLE